MISISFCLLFSSIALQLCLILMIPLFSGLAISDLTDWIELTSDSYSSQIFLLLVPIFLIILSICVWLLLFLRKKQLVMFIRIILIGVLLLIFFVVCIVTMCYTYSNKMSPTFTSELVSKRVELELQGKCCYQNDHIEYTEDTDKSYVYIYGDCPYIKNGSITKDETKCSKYEETSICAVIPNANQTQYICETTLNNSLTNFKCVYSVEIVAVILHIILLIDAISFYIRHFKPKTKNSLYEKLELFGCCENQWDDLLDENNDDSQHYKHQGDALENDEEKESGVIIN